MIRVRLAHADDQDELIEFIRDHWSASHIFTQEPDVFSWQYRQADGRLNMMLAESVADEGPPSREVLGVLGFIPMGRFDAALGDTDITLAIWKVRDGSPPGLGLRLLKQLQNDLQPRMIAAIGISDIVGPIYKVLKYEVSELEHCAIFNPAASGTLRLADRVPDAAFDEVAPSSERVTLTPLSADAPSAHIELVDRIAHGNRPKKSWGYVTERFFAHPWYDYTVSLVTHGEDAVAVVVWRTVEAEGTRVLRIVDIIGTTVWLADAHAALLEHVTATNAEYIDLMHWGIEPAVLDAAGFIGPRVAPDIIIPNYFSPFERRNIDIALAIKVDAAQAADDRGFLLFRADSDQDRPNTSTDLAAPPTRNA